MDYLFIGTQIHPIRVGQLRTAVPTHAASYRCGEASTIANWDHWISTSLRNFFRISGVLKLLNSRIK